MSFHRASGIIRSNKPKKPNVRFAAFDITSLGKIPYDRKYQYLNMTFYPLGTTPSPPVVYIPHILVRNKDEVTNLFNIWVGKGWEGLVGKNPNGETKVGKGSYDWMRLVYGGTKEFLVVNVYESEEVPGTLGGVVVEGNIRVGSGFVMDERIKYWKDPDLVVGKRATIAYKEITKAGSLRQPIWKGIRWDI
jgi:ATP-dependent DNA ligase